MKKGLFIVLVCCLLPASLFAQKSQPWTEWPKKDVDKLLNDSPWGQSESVTASMEKAAPKSGNQGPSGGGARGPSAEVKFSVRFFSAKPVREAIARKVIIDNPQMTAEKLKGFVEGDYSGSIMLAVTFEPVDKRAVGVIAKAFADATTETFKDSVYLERKDGKKIFIDEYAPPTRDGTGAKFIFPRIVDGKPFLTAESDTVRFVADFGGVAKIATKYKVSEMLFEGNLEY